jgi:hypothetical protein
MTTLLVLLTRLGLLSLLVFLFVVLFEHGPADYGRGVRQEWNTMRSTAGDWGSRLMGRQREDGSGPFREPPLPSADPASEPHPVAPESNRTQPPPPSNRPS